VMQATGLSRMTIYRLELAGKFPSRRRLAENSVAWLESDVAQWIDSRPVARLRGTPHRAAPPRPTGDAPRRTPWPAGSCGKFRAQRVRRRRLTPIRQL